MALQQEFMQIPLVTRSYVSACVLTTLTVQLDIITPYQIYFNPDLIFNKFQLWRLVTNFLYFGTVGFSFLFNLIFLYRYSRMLEEGSFRGRTSDFVFMFCFGSLLMSFVGLFANMVFLGQAFTLMLVYIWSRRNPNVRLSFFGVMVFRAPYLPWVLIGFSLMLGNPILVDAVGIGCGHVYYFLEDVFPEQPNGFRILKTPHFLKLMFDPREDNSNFEIAPEDEQPGGFQWQQENEEVVVEDNLHED